MTKRTLLRLLLLSVIGFSVRGTSSAVEPRIGIPPQSVANDSARPGPVNNRRQPKEKPLRELFVPFEDLEAVLAGGTRRVFLERDQYEKLLSQVKSKPEPHAPRAQLLLSSSYQAVIEETQARITGTLELEVLQPGVHAVAVNIGNLKLARASLDDEPAAIGNLGGGNLQVFVSGKGSHRLVMELLSSVKTGVADQALTVNLPQGAANTFKLQVPGDVELKSGATTLERMVNAESGQTSFDLLLPKHATTLMLSLNNRRQAEDRAVLARSVLVDELTEVYERLHASISLEVVHGVANEFRFGLPAELEITEVRSPLVARWEVKGEDPRVLEVTLREGLTKSAVMQITGVRTPGNAEEWVFPRLEPLEMAGQVSVVGMLLESRLKPVQLDSENLIAISANVLDEMLVAANIRIESEAGAPPLRAVAAYYAPQGDYLLSASLEKPPARLWATTNVLLTLGSTQLEAQGGFALLPLAERIFHCDIQVPAGWHLNQLTYGTDQPLTLEPYPQPDGSTRVHVRLPKAVEPGETYNLVFHAVSTPENWLGEWNENKQTVKFPVFKVVEAARDVGAVAVAVKDDLSVQPGELEALLPLDEARKAEFGLAGVNTSLAYRYERHPYSLELVAQRMLPRLTASVFSFFNIHPDQIRAHYELNYEITEAESGSLALKLPLETPSDITIRGLDGVNVKGYDATETKTHRIWTVNLAQRRSGSVRLAVDFEIPFDTAKDKTKVLPLVLADHVAYQSGIVGIEGDAELDLKVLPGHPRGVDVGELIDAEYQPGKRLLGVFGYVGQAAKVSIEATRHDAHELPSAIVQRAELVTIVSANGASQTAARFLLRTKAPFLDIQLPADATLWSAVVDGSPAKPQREDDRLLLSLPTKAAGEIRDLQIVYELPVRSLSLWTNLDVPAPELSLRSAVGSSALPTADLRWHLYLPNGYELVKSTGTVYTTALAERTRRGWLMDLAKRASPDLEMRLDQAFVMTKSRSDAATSAPASASDYDYEMAAGEEHSHQELGVGVNSGAGVELNVRAPSPGSRDMEELTTELDAIPPMDAPDEAKPDALVLEESLGPNRKPESAARKQKEILPPAEPAPQPAPPQTGTTGDNRNPTVVAGLPASDPSSGPWDVDKDGDGVADTSKVQLWALEGLRSLKIDLQPKGEAVYFESLGADPELSVTLIDRRKTDLLSMGMGLAVFLLGVCFTFKSARLKFQYIAAVLLITTLIPLITGWGAEIGYTLDVAFYTALVLVPYYVVMAIGLKLLRAVKPLFAPSSVSPTATALLLLSFSLVQLTTPVLAQAQAPIRSGIPTPPTPRGAANSGAASEPTAVGLDRLDLETSLPPVRIPDDAIVIPYDPEDEQGLAKATRLMIPYDKYVALWNRVHPDKRLDVTPLPAKFGLAGATVQATLSDAESLEVTAKIQLELLSDETVAIPLPLDGGVIVRAKLGDKPARLKIVQAAPVTYYAPAPQSSNGPPAYPGTTTNVPVTAAPAVQATNQPNPGPQSQVAQAAPAQADIPVPKEMVIVYASGKGRQTLEMVIRYPLTRQGGWHIAKGSLPAAPATSVELTVPKGNTEVKLGAATERVTLETEADAEKIATALDPSGAFQIQWRPRVSEAMLDRGLTVDSQAVLDVQEDGLRLIWQLGLKFRSGQRESFHVSLPSGWLVETVTGGNVRGWTVAEQEEEAESQQLEITLLKAARGSELLTLHLSQREAIGVDGPVEFSAPAIRVQDAALETGNLLVRRSPLLELRTMKTNGVSRLNLEEVQPLQQGLGPAESPLGIRPFQAYHFIALPYELNFSAQAVANTVTARVQTLLKIAEQDRRLETQVLYQAKERALYRLRLAVPVDLELEEPIVAGAFEWSSATVENRQIIELILADGQVGDFAITLRGVLATGEMEGTLNLPEIEVLDVTSQTGEIAVQADPALEVRPTKLTRCERSNVRQADAWLQGGQRETVRLVLSYRSAEYSGVLSVSPRTPQVTVRSVTNMRVTERTLEETILLDYEITAAGIRELVFRMPHWMRDARIQVPMLREKILEEVSDDEVRVRLKLQDAVMGQLRVLVENDRLPDSTSYQVPIPAIENAKTENRFVTLESSGRDEILVDERKGLEALDREQLLWKDLTALLPGNITQAFVVAPGATAPTLVLKPKRRDVVETTSARIGFAQTLLVVDAASVYRATQLYRVDNATEQHLDVQLPQGATLWTASVAGQPVKVAQIPKQPEQVRIPLVKTAPGDQDFEVTLKYGGRMDNLSTLTTVSFPLLHTINIQVELSQVRLWLPEQYRWFDFGGSMGQVSNESDLLAGFLAYKNRQIQKLLDTLSTSSSYSKVRAKSNIKQIEQELDQVNTGIRRGSENAELSKEFVQNSRILDEAERQIRADETKAKEVPEDFNRYQLNAGYAQQELQRSSNVVNDLGRNFDAPTQPAKSKQSQSEFQSDWIKGKLKDTTPQNAPPGENPPAGETSQSDGDKQGEKQQANKSGGYYGRSGKKGQVVTNGQNALNQPQAAQVFEQGNEMDKSGSFKANSGDGEFRGAGQKFRGRSQESDLERYEKRLEAQQQGEQGQRRSQRNGTDTNSSGYWQGKAPGQEFVGANIADEQSGRWQTAIPNDDLANQGWYAGELASLDVEIPERGIEYLFSTPRGDVQITARVISKPVSNRLVRLGFVSLLILVGALVYRRVNRTRPA